MTNAQIIFNAEQELAKAGKIRYTGRTFPAVDHEGNPIEVKETEPIHTYQYWKAAGYQVMKGQKAIAQVRIWKHTVKPETIQGKNEKGEAIEITQDNARMFMKVASFFSLAQVEKIA